MAAEHKVSQKSVNCACNKCGEKLSIPTSVFYQERPKAHYKTVVKEPEKVVDGNKIAAVTEQVFVPAVKLRHTCGGTYSTVPSVKLKTHKASRDRKPKGSMKG